MCVFSFKTILTSLHFQKKDGYPYNCSILPLFELGSLHHDFYLINIRIPVDYARKINTELGHIADMWLFVSIVMVKILKENRIETSHCKHALNELLTIKLVSVKC